MTFEDRIEAIVSDRRHGSSWLVERICTELGQLARARESTRKLTWAFARLRDIDPSMAVVHHLLDTLEPCIGGDFAGQLAAYEAHWRHLDRAIAGELLERMDWHHRRVLTHSHSGVLIRVARQVASRVQGLELWQTRSEPGGEGELQYRELRDAGIAARLIDDADLPGAAPHLDAAWLGMDQYSDTAFVNKRGSGAIVDTFTALARPVFVLGDCRKKVTSLRYSRELFEAVPFTEGVLLVTGQAA